MLSMNRAKPTLGNRSIIRNGPPQSAAGEPKREERDHQRSRKYSRPSWRDWMLLSIALLFVIAGLLILPRNPNVGIVTLAFFGTCAVVFLGSIARELRFQRFRASRVEVAGGVPIRPSRGRILLAGGWLTVLGFVIMTFGAAYPLLMRVLAGFIAAVGLVIVAGALMGWFPREFLQFDGDAFTIARRGYRARIPWDHIAHLDAGVYNNNAILLIWVDDLGAVIFDPEGAEADAYRATAGGPMFGAHFALTTRWYSFDLAVLTAAILSYARDANARDHLKQRGLPAFPAG